MLLRSEIPVVEHWSVVATEIEDSPMASGIVLVLSGPPGVGKTTVAWRVFDLCAEAGEDPAFVDLDMLGSAWPAPADDPNQARLRATNLAAVWANYRAVGSRRLIIADVVESDADRKRLAAAVDLPVVVCRLEASADALESRIRGRGRDHGSGLVKLVNRSAELARRLAATDIKGFSIATENRSVDDIAAEVRKRWRDLTT